MAARGFSFYHGTRQIDWQQAFAAKRCGTFCPIHELSGEHTPSAQITITDGRPLIWCFVCKRRNAVFDAALSARCSATWKAPASSSRPNRGPATVVASYRYPHGHVKQRLALGDGRKSFAWLTPDGPGGMLVPGLRGDPGLYGADRLTHTGHISRKLGRVIAVEGEKDTDALHALGLNAVSLHLVSPAAVEALAAWTVAVIPDDDAPGIRRATEFAYLALHVTPEIAIVPPLSFYVAESRPRGYDVSDFLAEAGELFREYTAPYLIDELAFSRSLRIDTITGLPPVSWDMAHKFWTDAA